MVFRLGLIQRYKVFDFHEGLERLLRLARILSSGLYNFESIRKKFIRVLYRSKRRFRVLKKVLCSLAI